MSLYSQVYNEILTTSNQKYKKLHNLYLLKGVRQKINCFRTFQAKPDQYYDCFYQVEGTLLRQGQEFVGNCEQIDDQYKLCLNDCKENFKNDNKKKDDCYNVCSGKFKNSIAFLYENFYQTHVGKEAEYKSAKKE